MPIPTPTTLCGASSGPGGLWCGLCFNIIAQGPNRPWHTVGSQAVIFVREGLCSSLQKWKSMTVLHSL